MGQNQSIPENIIPDTVDTLHIEVLKHARVFSEIGLLTYEHFRKCLDALNELSRKCSDSNGKQLMFLVKKGTDSSVFWKATVRIACVKVNPETRQIESHKFLNLKQFLCVFKTFESHLHSLMSTEEQRDQQSISCGTTNVTASILLDHVNNMTRTSSSESSTPEQFNECCICLDRKTEVLLPCAHTFCCPCIEQWNVNNKTCPICSEELASTDDTWVMSEKPGADEISDKICSELMNLSKEAK
uniref:RING finger protein 141 n=1 Tax=Tabanus bromius TaxID=304241 RepID=A0A0K8TM66_TABBR